ncbi:hypothetical protein HPP92_014545 [Vanilla planifolia]|uniref:Mechanosensitive ion channel protein n=1 Tax=Vanilla planifolia TaxID=51239 RepID=A0A835USU4_VANPL|nr:hypothetical protein HPP92_014545 [Vanilla planifolia]
MMSPSSDHCRFLPKNMNSLRKSFKTHTSKVSSWSRSADHEEQRWPILRASDEDDSGNNNNEVAVKVDDERNETPMQIAGVHNSRIWRKSSYGFLEEGNPENGVGQGPSEFTFQSPKKRETPEMSDDPPSRLISSFLQSQRTAGAEMVLDMDLEMDELKKSATSSSGSKEPVVFLGGVSTYPSSRNMHEEVDSSSSDDKCGNRRKSATASPHAREGAAAEVLRCTSNSAFRPSSAPFRAKTKSRLLDSPPADAVSGGCNEKKPVQTPKKSGILKSGFLGKSPPYDDDDDDPFADVPENLKRTKLSTITFLELIGLVVLLAGLICSLAISKLACQTVWDLHLWKWEVLVLVLICGRLLSGWFIRIVVFFLERNFILRKRFLYFVYGVRNAVQNCIWLGLVLLAWNFLFDKKLVGKNKTLSYVTRVLFCLFVATVLRLVKTLLIKVLASSFHVSTYFDRIQEALFNQYVIETLSGPPLFEAQHKMKEEHRTMVEVQKLQNAGAKIPNDLRAAVMQPRKDFSSQFEKSKKLSRDLSRKDFSRQQLQLEGGITMDQLHRLNQRNVSAWNMKRLMRIVMHGTLMTLDEQITHREADDESSMAIRSEHEAKIAARKIFCNVAHPGARFITLVDLMRFMREDESVKTMNLLNGTQCDDRISRRALKNWVVNAFRERRALSLTLNDTKTAVNKLHQIANVIVAIIVIAIWLLILNIAKMQFFVFLSSQILLLVFIFGNTFKTTFEAIIFLFVMHPFDVGDRCEVDGVQMVVEEMNILTTIFLRYDNQKITYPNSVLATLPIGNFYRSPDMGDNIDFCIHVSTPAEKLALMRERMIAFMESKKDHWHPGAQVVLRDIDDMNRLKISIWMRHRINFQDMGMKFSRRELVVQELIRVLRELDIEYRMLPLDVNLRDLPPVTSNRLPSTWTTCS